MKNLTASNIKTKNVPDAIEWHFAKYWTHILPLIGKSKGELECLLKPSSEIIERCVALPIMVKTSSEEVEKIAEKVTV